ncbi:MAG TPA: LuxR C-terminal-related transcriptional regulator, partial [Candidatus Limnocylindria bacterium]|nr:LuxR C-terminal-related transcriptional regulator [Candidatus Limnocylindria bacterium]
MLADSDRTAELQDAHDRMLALGAHAVARKVAGQLRRVGGAVRRGPRTATRGNPARLTERQMEVARLVAQGRSNRDIAAHLVLTEKTVGHHVSAVLSKLDVQRRAEVAGALSEFATSQR